MFVGHCRPWPCWALGDPVVSTGVCELTSGRRRQERGLVPLKEGKRTSNVENVPSAFVVSAEGMWRPVERGRSRNDRVLPEEPCWAILRQPCDNLGLRRQLKLFASGLLRSLVWWPGFLHSACKCLLSLTWEKSPVEFVLRDKNAHICPRREKMSFRPDRKIVKNMNKKGFCQTLRSWDTERSLKAWGN